MPRLLWFGLTAFTSTAQATLAARLFRPEVFGETLLNQTATATGARALSGYVIPQATGGAYQVATNEGLFVFTVRSNLSGYFAMTPWGDSNVTATRRSSPITATFSTNDPPQCHRQLRTNTSTGYPMSAQRVVTRRWMYVR